MATQVTCQAEGVSRLVIEVMTGDGHIRGVPGLTDIVITPAGGEHDEGGSPFRFDAGRLYYQGGRVARLVLPAHVSVEVARVNGDLHVQDLGGELEVGVVHGDLVLRELSGSVHLEQVDGDVRADGVAQFHLAGPCRGDMRFSEGGTLEVQEVAGDLRLNGVERVEVEKVHGDLWAERVMGDLQVGRIDGDGRLDDITGAVQVGVVSGDLKANGLIGGLSAPVVHGDAQLLGDFGAEQSYVLSADGDAAVRVPADADLKLQVRANGRVRSDIQLTPSPDGTPVFTAVLGSGSGRLNVAARGDVRISQAGNDRRAGAAAGNWTDMGEQIRQQVTASLAAAGINPETGEINFSPFGPGRGPKGQRGRTPEPPPPRQGTGSAGPARQATGPQGPTAEEQMLILRMVEAGTISAEEAETLLKALGPER